MAIYLHGSPLYFNDIWLSAILYSVRTESELWPHQSQCLCLFVAFHLTSALMCSSSALYHLYILSPILSYTGLNFDSVFMTGFPSQNFIWAVKNKQKQSCEVVAEVSFTIANLSFHCFLLTISVQFKILDLGRVSLQTRVHSQFIYTHKDSLNIQIL